MIEFYERGAQVSVDVEATRRMYTLIDHGETDDCSCGTCAYFSAHKNDVYPQEIRDVLGRLGIDATKENETWSVEDSKGTVYCGNFDFVGTVNSDAAPVADKGRLAPAIGSFNYVFSTGAGYPWTEKRAVELGFSPISTMQFIIWVPIVFPWAEAHPTEWNETLYSFPSKRLGFYGWLRHQFPGIFSRGSER